MEIRCAAKVITAVLIVVGAYAVMGVSMTRTVHPLLDSNQYQGPLIVPGVYPRDMAIMHDEVDQLAHLKRRLATSGRLRGQILGEWQAAAESYNYAAALIGPPTLRRKGLPDHMDTP